MNNQAQHFPGLEIKPVTKHYVDCPVCSNERAFQVDHLCKGHPDVHGQTCDSCDTYFRFTYENGKINLVTALEKSIPVLALLKYAGNSVNEKLFFVIETKIYPEDPSNRNRDKEFDSLQYRVEEHTCPTNLIPVECIIHNGDDDHHGVVELVDFVSIKELREIYGVTKEELLDSNNNHYQHYFAKHTGMEVIHEIDDNQIYEGTAQSPPKLTLPHNLSEVKIWTSSTDTQTLFSIERWLGEKPKNTIPNAKLQLNDFLDHLIAEGYRIDKSQFTNEQLNYLVWPKSIQQQDSPITGMSEFSVTFSSINPDTEETDPKSV